MSEPMELMEEFLDHIGRDDPRQLAAFLTSHHPADVARALEHIHPTVALKAFKQLDTELAAAALAEIQGPLLETLLEELSHQEIADLVEEMDPDDAADVLSEMEEVDQDQVLAEADPETRETVEELLQYPEDSAGGLMDSFVVKLHREMTLEEAAAVVRHLAEENRDSIAHNAYVVDEKGHLEGRLPLRTFILHHPESVLEDVMETGVKSIPVTMDQEKVARLFRQYNFEQMPVVDAEGRLVGRILVDDVLDVLDEEHEEDILLLAGLSAEENLKDGPLVSVRRRIPWLIGNLALALFSGKVVAMFEPTIERAAILAAFMPMVAGLGGNAGTQSIALVVRALAVGQIPRKVAIRYILREAVVGLLIGIGVGALMAVVAWAMRGNPWLGALLGVALLLNITLATVLGTVVPLVLRKFGKDPAVASSVFVTPLTDAAGFFIFLGLATLFLSQLVGGFK